MVHSIIAAVIIIGLIGSVAFSLFFRNVDATKICGSSAGGQTGITLYDKPLILTNVYTEINDDTKSDIIGQGSANLVGDTITRISVALSYLEIPQPNNNDTIIIGVFDGTTGNTLSSFNTFNANTMIRHNTTIGGGADGANYYNGSGSFTLSTNQVIGVKIIPTGISSQSTDIIVSGFFQTETGTPGIVENFNGGGFFLDNSNNYVMTLIGNTHGNGHNTHCTDALNVMGLVPIVAIGGIILYFLKTKYYEG